MSGVEHTVAKVSEEALEEMLQSLEEGKIKASSVVDQKLSEALSEVQRISELKDRQADALKRQIIGSAEMTARNKSLEIVEENLNLAFAQASGKLETTAKGQEYEKTLKAMTLEAIEQIGGGEEFILRGNSRDQKLLKKIADTISNENNLKVSLDTQALKCTGGVSVGSKDGYVMFDNTFEARLERLKPTLRKEISQLFLEK